MLDDAQAGEAAPPADVLLDAYVAIMRVVQERLRRGELVTLPGFGGLRVRKGRPFLRAFPSLCKAAADAPPLPAETVSPALYWLSQRQLEGKADPLTRLVDHARAYRTRP
jgi:hypothetical protein